MAEQEQVERLKRSVEEWNHWRQQQPNLLHPDLSEANLDSAWLPGAWLYMSNLFRARLALSNLSEATLSGANLSESNLSGADLEGAALSGTNLGGANLSGAHFVATDLSESNLSGANLSGTTLVGTNLRNANLNETRFRHTTFAMVDLSLVKGLDTAIHDGPSIVNINSVMLPRDEHTRLHFLHGVGFTETQIEYLPSLLTPRPIEYHSLFVSYAHQDEVLARRLHTNLRSKDVPCWFASHDLQPGSYFRAGIDQAIHTQDKVLLLLSEHSVNSGWVRYEVELALARENRQQREVLFPIRLDDAIFQCTARWATSLRETRHIGNFTSWQDDGAYQLAFTALLRHLKVAKPSTL